MLSMLVALAMSVLADATPLTYTAPNNGIAQGSHCSTFGHLYEGSEDATLWRAGLAFVSSGLMPSKTQGGLILLANLTGAVPAVTPVPIYAEKNFSAYGFRPHGLHLDNSSSKLYAVSHSDQLQEESIFVFDILSKGTLKLPALKFRYLLTSPHFEYYPRKMLWYLNDVAVVDGASELYVTQLGPLDFSPATFKLNKALWRCTWEEDKAGADGRLAADCTHAVPTLFLGLNGIAIDPHGTSLLVNDEFGGSQGASRLVTYRRNQTDGQLTARESMGLNGSSIDNVELDAGSRDLTMGQYANRHQTSKDAGVLVKALPVQPAAPTRYKPARVMGAAALPGNVTFQVSSALRYGEWTLLGSPWDRGPFFCRQMRL